MNPRIAIFQQWLSEQRASDVVSTWEADSSDADDARLCFTVALAYGEQQAYGKAAALLRPIAATPHCPANVLALYGRVSLDHGDHAAAEDALFRANQLAPNNAMWWLWFAQAAAALRKPERALAAAKVFAEQRMTSAELSTVYANLLVHAQRHDEALLEFKRALALPNASADLVVAYCEYTVREFAESAYSLTAPFVSSIDAGALSAARVRASLTLPTLYRSDDEAAQWRTRLLERLHCLRESALRSKLSIDERAHCLATTPFFASFHDADVTEIQIAWGDFVEALALPARTAFSRPQTQSAAQRGVHTIGIVSNRLTDSSAGRFFNPWIDTLCEAGFTVRLYAIGAPDAVTQQLASKHALKVFPEDDVDTWRPLAEAISADANDVLLFPEPQGSPLTLFIAALKLAPIQCAAFGNPITTGLSTIDYFLSPDAAEVDTPTPHYRERVIRLAGNGTRFTRATPTTQLSREQFGLKPSDRVYLVNQQLQKWTPRFIEAVIAILKSDRAGKLAFWGIEQHLSLRAFEQYLRARLHANGINDTNRLIKLPPMKRDAFLAFNALADVSLDTFGFSGGATTVDALSVGLPIVSLEGRWLRGRQSAAIIRSMGLHDSIAHSPEDYIALALSANLHEPPEARIERAQAWWRSPQQIKRQHNEAVFADIASFMHSLR